jgi:uncharacterized RDD family membrane protein YckC
VAKLIINPTTGARKEVPVANRVISIGRDPSNDLVLSDAMVSRRHAILELRGEQYVLRDNNSSNGTLVNGDRVVHEHLIRDGDLIAIGACRLLFEGDGGTRAQSGVTEPQPAASPSVPGPSCRACGAPAVEHERFCRQCGHDLVGTPQRVVCPACGGTTALPANFCGLCGVPLPKAADRRLPTLPVMDLDGAGASSESASPSARRSTPEPALVPPKPRAAVTVLDQSQERRDESPPVRREPTPPPVARRAPSSRGVSEPAAVQQDAAGFWIRLAAYLIDGFILALPMGVVLGGVALASLRSAAAGELDPGTASAGDAAFLMTASSIIGFLLPAVYCLAFWSTSGATPGKRLLGLRILRGSGEPALGVGRAALRLFGYALSFLLLGVGFLIIAFSQDKRALHDRLADTRVVRRF